MAVATATINYFPYPKGNDNTQRFQVRRGTIAISTGTYPPGGFPLSWNVGDGVKAIPNPSLTPSSTGTIFPVDVDLKSTGDLGTSGGTGPSGFVYIWDSVLGNLHAFVSTTGLAGSTISGPLVEFGGNIPGSMQNDTVQFTAYFVRE